MKKIFAVAFAASLAGCATTSTEMPTEEDVDLARYMGTWYEQARLPNRFQKDCAGDVRADYEQLADGKIKVTNQCKRENGETKVAVGEGRLSKAVEPPNPAILEVRFAPAWTSWLPMVWGDYWIIKLEGDYQHSLVGTPDRKYLWVLSRDERADQTVVDRLLDHAETLQFPVDEVIRTAD